MGQYVHELLGSRSMLEPGLCPSVPLTLWSSLALHVLGPCINRLCTPRGEWEAWFCVASYRPASALETGQFCSVCVACLSPTPADCLRGILEGLQPLWFLQMFLRTRVSSPEVREFILRI